MNINKIVSNTDLRDDNFPLEYCERCGKYYRYDYCDCR